LETNLAVRHISILCIAKMADKRPLIVSIEGPIAAGKSVLAVRLSEYARKMGLNVITVLEPVEAWTDNSIYGPVVPGVDRPQGGFLQLFYKNPERWAFTFQMFVLNTRVQAIERAFKESGCTKESLDLVILERTPMTDPIFMYLQKDKISPVEFEAYKSCCDSYTRILPFSIEDIKVILVQPSVEVCMERLAHRARLGESSGVPIEYQKALIQAHNDYFMDTESDMKKNGIKSRVPVSSVIVLDSATADKNFKDDSEESTQILKDIMASLNFS